MTKMTKGALVAGNWKMNGLKASKAEFDKIVAGIAERGDALLCDTLICPPTTLLQSFASAAASTGSSVALGAQNCHPLVSGAHTGDISAEMIADAGGSYIIVGHSERRLDHGETNDDVKAKAVAAHRARMKAIICVGEDEETRLSGMAENYVTAQLVKSLPDDCSSDNTLIAYEPIWAIGTGRVPSVADVAAMHAHIRSTLERTKIKNPNKVKILYGGSVKASNAGQLMSADNVSGALVGGASLKAEDFLGIIDAAYCV